MMYNASYYEVKGVQSMSSISIHNLDLNIERKIRLLADKKHQSINKTVKDILGEVFEEPAPSNGNRKRFEKFSGIWSEQEYKAFCQATEDFDKVDPENWK